jgi:hypothetical protein
MARHAIRDDHAPNVDRQSVSGLHGQPNSGLAMASGA